MNGLWLLLAEVVYAQPIVEIANERDRIAREIARIEDEIAKFKSLQLAA